MKKVIVIALAGIMVMSALPMSFANVSTARSTEAVPSVALVDANYEFTFEDFISGFKSGSLSETQKAELKKLFDQAMSYEKSNKWDEANKVWDDIYKIVDKYLPDEFGTSEAVSIAATYPKTLDEYLAFDKDFLKPMSATEKANLEKLYKTVLSLNDSKDYDALSKAENAFYDALEKFYKYDDTMDSALIEPIQEMSFDDYLKMFEGQLIPITAAEKAILKAKYEGAMKLINGEKYDDFEKAMNEFDNLMAKFYDYKAMYADKTIDGMIEGIELTTTEKQNITNLYNKLQASIKAGNQVNIVDDVKVFEKALDELFEKHFPISIYQDDLAEAKSFVMDEADFDLMMGLENFIQSKESELKPFSDTDYDKMLSLYEKAMKYKDDNKTTEMNKLLGDIVTIINQYKK